MDEENKKWLDGELNFYFRYKRKIIEGLIVGSCINVGCGEHIIPNAVNIDENATKLPYKDNSFDTVVLSDVIEHIKNWEDAVKEALRTAKKKVIITVPAYKFLWSDYDKFLGHYRRYSKKDIDGYFKRNNLSLKYNVKFLFGMLTPLYYIRKFTSGETPNLPKTIDNFLYYLSHIRLPFGPTLLLEVYK